MKLTKDNVAQVYGLAVTAAEKATKDYLSKYGDRDCCGFAWVEIHPARGPMVSYLKSIEVGHKGYPSGYHIWNPSGHVTQCITAKEEGARAFAEVLRSVGVDCYSASRMD